MRTGRPTTPLTVTSDERRELDSLAHRSRSAPHVARRARIVLACADGGATTAIAKRLHVSPTTICKWRSRFLQDRLDGLFDEPRPGAPRRITDDQVEQSSSAPWKARLAAPRIGVRGGWRTRAASAT